MPVPPCTADGWLPPGVHDCTLEDVKAAFANGGASVRRVHLWNNLAEFLKRAQASGAFCAAYIDGSFTSMKSAPADIDVILEISALLNAIPMAALPLLYNAAIKQQYELDVYLRHVSMQNDFCLWFQYVRSEDLNRRGLPPSTRKGLLRVPL